MRITLSEDERFLEVDFEAPQRTLSWAVIGGGFGVHRRVVWHFVCREEMVEGLDPVSFFHDRLKARGFEAAVGLLTARYLRPYAQRHAICDEVEARAIVTCGLGNALRAGDPPAQFQRFGTINVLCHVTQPLSDAGMLEALALASEARTLALLELRYPSVVSERPATGTGTDCIVIACPEHGTAHDYAGKHTAIGAALGLSVYEATKKAAEVWLQEAQERQELTHV